MDATCYNILKFLWDQCRDDQGNFVRDTNIVFDKALVAWEKLCEDPESLLYDRKRRSRLQNLNEQAAERDKEAAVA